MASEQELALAAMIDSRLMGEPSIQQARARPFCRARLIELPIKLTGMAYQHR